MRVLFCGSRTFSEDHVLDSLILGLAENYGKDEIIVITGGAPGADSEALDTAQVFGLTAITYSADWERLGKMAGPIRNQQMLDDGQPDLVIALVDKPLAESKGTNHMVTIAKEAGIPTYVIEKVR